MDEPRVSASALAALGITGWATAMSRHYLSSHHLWSAKHYARLTNDLEIELSGTTSFDPRHNAYAMSAVQSAAAFIEAFANEVFADAAEVDPDQDFIHPRVAPLGAEAIAKFADYRNHQDFRNDGALRKYTKGLSLAGRNQPPSFRAVYNEAQLLMKIRRGLAHFFPAYKGSGVVGDDQFTEADSKRFPPNALMAGMGNSWFHHHCLGAGCATWAVDTAETLVDSWTEDLGIPQIYKTDVAHYVDSI